MADSGETGAIENLAMTVRANWSCLIEPTGAGAAGEGEEFGAELLTQHGLSQAQRVQQAGALTEPSAEAAAGSSDCVTASNRLNNMAKVAFN